VNNYLVIGASNSDRLAAVLGAAGLKVVRIKTTNWIPTMDAVAALATHVKDAVAKENSEVLVFHMLDNILYLARNAYGSAVQPRRGADGQYHIEGDLVLAHKDVQYNIYKALKPVLAASGNRPFIIVTPIPRYVIAPCCETTDHLTNYLKEDFVSNMLDELNEVKGHFRSFLFSDNIRRASVINPTPLLDSNFPKQDWDNAVHPAKAFYDKLAELVISSAERLSGKRKAMEDNSGNNGGMSGPVGQDWRSRSSGETSGRQIGREWAGTSRGPRTGYGAGGGGGDGGGRGRYEGGRGGYSGWRGRRGRGRY